METLLQLLDSFQINEQTFFLSVILIATVLVMFTLFLVVLGTRAPMKVRLEELKKTAPGEKLKKGRRLGNTLDSIAPTLTPSNSKESQSLRQQLMHAGYHDANALTVFYAIKGMAILVGVGIAAMLYFFVPEMSNLKLAMVASVAVGLYTPNIGLNYFVNKRQSRIRGGVPDALDLLVVCTESGLGFSAALRRVADELMISHPDFADELDTVCVKIKAGVEMSDAFEDLVERTGIKELAGLVTMLSHASRIGGSLSQTLREYTEDFRDKRNQEIEEIAAKIPTKMIFPLLLFIWPCFFIVAIGPSMLSITSTLGN
ncbi:type II secretion system F family protein [Vibrio sinaloensis]|uniref:type II secretion system F family protein n=1 Tax=Photobacterium sp. (strain ATCC 43367) TaxID=379097 RepID=UPI00057F2BE4|nr:type II secretion system F family protein [Vibrio sinaloensis]KHT46202.1 pilus assembly protein TadC [Vibrio sinaloensis]